MRGCLLLPVLHADFFQLGRITVNIQIKIPPHLKPTNSQNDTRSTTEHKLPTKHVISLNIDQYQHHRRRGVALDLRWAEPSFQLEHANNNFLPTISVSAASG